MDVDIYLCYKYISYEVDFVSIEKTRLLIVGGGRVNGESMFPGPRNGETLGEL